MRYLVRAAITIRDDNFTGGKGRGEEREDSFKLKSIKLTQIRPGVAMVGHGSGRVGSNRVSKLARFSYGQVGSCRLNFFKFI